jgi:hypothetical protein
VLQLSFGNRPSGRRLCAVAALTFMLFLNLDYLRSANF